MDRINKLINELKDIVTSEGIGVIDINRESLKPVLSKILKQAPERQKMKRGRPKNKVVENTECVKTKSEKYVKPEHKFLRSIRNNPKKVIITNTETGESREFSSIYKASKKTGLHPNMIRRNVGKCDSNFQICIC